MGYRAAILAVLGVATLIAGCGRGEWVMTTIPAPDSPWLPNTPTPPPDATPGTASTPSPTPTPTRTPTPTHTPTQTHTPTHTPTPPPASALLEPMNYQAQTLNNCGPASIAIILGYYDHWITQSTVNEHVPPGPSPCQIADYVLRYDLRARSYWSPRSDITPIRLLLANGIPVIANQLLEEESNIGHYRVIKGYDDASGVFITDDPLQRKGPGYRLTYDAFDRLSNPGGFIAIYPPKKDRFVRTIMEEYNLHEIRYCRP